MPHLDIVLSIEARGKGITDIGSQTIREINGLCFDKYGTTQLEDYQITRNDGSKFILRASGKNEATGLYKYLIISDYEKDINQKKVITAYSDGNGLDFAQMKNNPEYFHILANDLLSQKRLDKKTALARQYGFENAAFIAHISYVQEIRRLCKTYVQDDATTLSMMQTLLNRPPKNIVEYPQNIERCRSAILDGYGFSKAEGDISLGKDMWASMRIGKKRSNQEDAIGLFTNSVPDFKMAIVADGVGGINNGEKASHMVVDKLGNWFKELDQRHYQDELVFLADLTRAIEEVNREIFTEFKENGGSTLVCAATCRNKTVVANVGDSRAYVMNQSGMTQITDDDSYVNTLVQLGKIKKEDARFHKSSNKITKFMGQFEATEPKFTFIDRGIPIILVSDGVSDCLSDPQMSIISQRTNLDELSKSLVDMACKVTSKAGSGLNPSIYNSEISAGKDNASAAVIR